MRIEPVCVMGPAHEARAYPGVQFLMNDCAQAVVPLLLFLRLVFFEGPVDIYLAGTGYMEARPAALDPQHPVGQMPASVVEQLVDNPGEGLALGVGHLTWPEANDRVMVG